MTTYLKRGALLMSFLLTAIAASGCHKNNPVVPVVPVDSTTAPPPIIIPGDSLNAYGFTVSGFGSSGSNLVAGAYTTATAAVFIFLSKDDGLTWKLEFSFPVISSSPGFNFFLTPSADFANDATVLLAGAYNALRGAIYRSTDQGLTWSDSGVTWPESGEYDLDENINCLCLSDGKIFSGTDHGVFVSGDHGSTWSLAGPKIPPATSIVSTGGSIFASTSAQGIYRSTDQGASWAEVDTSRYNFLSLAVNGTDVFVGAVEAAPGPSSGGVFETTDNGNTWHHVDAELPDHYVDAVCTYGAYLFAGTNSGVFVSSDTGAVWTQIAGPNVRVNEFLVHGGYLFGNSGGGVWRYPLSSLPSLDEHESRKLSQK